MKFKNKVFIATSLDGYIADKDGGIDWLDTFPEINNIDSGYHAFIADIDAMLMGRATFEKVLSFNVPWPYEIPVYVLSNSLKDIPPDYKDKVVIVNGKLEDVLEQIHQNGHYKLYIDGGKTIQSFLGENLIDEMIITVIPILLGSGIPLFGDLPTPVIFECRSSKIFLDKIVQNHFVRKINS